MGNAAGHFQLFGNDELPKRYLFVIYFFVAILLRCIFAPRINRNRYETIGKTTAAAHAVG